MDAYARTLRDGQQADGSWLSYSVPVGSRFDEAALTYRTTFVPALIMGALAGINEPEIQRLRHRATDWLLAQHSPAWSFNYWAREAAESQSRAYPDDWDDTSCAVIALTQTRPELMTGEVLGRLVNLLTNTEAQEGGPYGTWLVGPDAHEHWHDVDIAVNSNIAYMLKLHGVELPNLERLADERIAAGQLTSPYYPSPYPIEYFLSRWYRGQHQTELLRQILDRRRGGAWDNPLHTALAISACLNLGAEPDDLREAVEALRSPSTVPALAFCIDPAIDGTQYVAGSPALSAAFCLEAIAKFDAATRARKGRATTPSAARAESHGSKLIHEQVLAKVMARLEQPGPEIQTAAEQMVRRLMDGMAGGQITLLPHLFRRALGESGQRLRDERVVELGATSLYGWLAYTVYDDFLDAEGQPPLLPMANVALRELVHDLQREAGRVPGFGDLAWPILDRQEAANAWEVSHCRVKHQRDLTQIEAPSFGDRRVLYERSMGHALGCLAIAMELGHQPGSPELQALQAFFRHFLLARQLGDDAHDWQADLQKGQINAVGAYLLAGVPQRGRTVRAVYHQLEQYFWEQAVGEVNGWIFEAAGQARAALQQVRFIAKPQVLEALLEPIEEGARLAQAQQAQTAEFLRGYQHEG